MMEQLSKRFLSLLLCAAMAFGMLPGAASAAEGPTAIASAEAFAGMDAGGNYLLTEDITITTPYATPFTGTFDGDGHTITVTIESDSANVGLFSQLGGGATIKNLTVAGTVSAPAKNNVGGIAGQANSYSGNITIENCLADVAISGNKAVGGIVGAIMGSYNTITVNGCANIGAVTGANSQVGGIAGAITGGVHTVSNCYNHGQITGFNYVGGILGQVASKNTSQISYSYSTGSIALTTTNTNAGALVGLAPSVDTTNHCYGQIGTADALVGNNGPVGDQVLFQTQSAMQEPSFAELLGPAFRAVSNDYPLLVWQTPKAEKFAVSFTLTPSDADVTVKNTTGAGQTGANGVYKLPAGEYTYTASAFGYETKADVPFTVAADATIEVTLEESPRQTVTFTGLPDGAALSVTHAVGGAMAAELDGSYRLPDGDYIYTAIAKGHAPAADIAFTVGGAAVEQVVYLTPLATQDPWDGVQKTEPVSVGGVYYIKNGAELAWLTDHTAADAVLLTDIDLNEKPWASIGGYNNPYRGVFNGNGCTVKNLAGTGSFGLFYSTDAAGVIENLTVSGSITGSSNIGGIVGVNSGTIRNCAANVTISATGQRVGGVAGNNSGGTITGCAALAAVSSSYTTFSNTVNLGGVTGQNSGTVKDSYSVAAVTATGSNHNGNVGGITGANEGTLQSCYSAGTVSYPMGSDKATGAIVGTLSKGALTNTFYLEGSCAAGVGVGSADGTQALSDTAMKKYALPLALNGGSGDGPFYQAASESQNSGYPVLKWQGGKAPVATGDEKAVIADKAALTLTQTVYTQSVTISLPTAGAQGSAIAWVSSNPAVVSNSGVVTLPTAENKVTVTLTATLTKGEARDSKVFTLTVYSAEQVVLDRLSAAKATLGTKPLKPVCPWDTNIIAVAKQRLIDAGFTDVSLTLHSNGDSPYIAADGKITYFYEAPNGPLSVFASLVFTLTKDGRSIDSGPIQASIPWDRTKVLEVMKSQVADRLTWGLLKGSNVAADQVTVALTLPVKLEGAEWATISWESSSQVLFPEEADVGAYTTTGTVVRARLDTPVTLTATVKFNLTASGEGDITLAVPFALTVLGDGEADSAEKMQEKLESYTLDKLIDFTTREKISPAAVTGDIQFPSPSKTGVADFSAYKFTVTSKSTDVLTVNGYRGYIYRPLPGEESREVTFTVTMTSRATPSLSVSKDLAFTVKPLTQKEINDAVKLMEAVKAGYARALLGENSAANSVTGDLAPFREAVFAPNGTDLVYSRALKDDTNRGILVDDLPGSEPDGPGYEVWRVYRTSRPDVLEHDILRLTRPTYDTALTVESVLTHEVLGKYAAMYPDNEDFKKLYQVPVSAGYTVKGSTGADNPEPDRTFSVSFALNGKGYIQSIPAAAVGDWKAGATAFDVFKKVLANKGFTYEGSGKYVFAVTDSSGARLAEMDVSSDSGWLYTVNGAYPTKGMNEFYLTGGESIEFLYTADWKQEPGISGGNESKPESGGTVKPPAATDKNGEAKAEVSTKDVESAIAAAKKSGGSGIVIEPNVKGNASKVSVALPAQALAEFAKEAGAMLTVKTAIAHLSIPGGALSELAKGGSGTVTVSAETVKSADGKATGEIRLEIKAGGKTMDTVTGGFTVALPAVKPTAGTVLMRITDEGAKIVKKSAVEGETLTALLSGSATVMVKENAATFSDVDGAHWGRDAVAFVSSHKLFRGTGEGTFDPAGDMSRGMLLTVLARMEERETAAGGTWYASSVLWAAEQGISDGGDPEGSITREQLAVMLYRYAGSPAAKGTETGFSDGGSVSAWAKDAMAWAVDTGLLNGSAGLLSPGGKASRAEVAAVLQRFVPLLIK